jgi:hypothetical protein
LWARSRREAWTHPLLARPTSIIRETSACDETRDRPETHAWAEEKLRKIRETGEIEKIRKSE